MTTSSMPDLLGRLRAHRLVPVVTIDDLADAVPLAKALVAGGLPVAEVTFRTSIAADAIRAIADTGLTETAGLLLGAGTVLTPDQVDAAVAAGAGFVISPGLDRSVVERCREHGVPVLPGMVTPTEVQAALALGLEAVKFFPAGPFGGAATVKALSAPFPQLQFIPTGGIDGQTAGDYLAIPAVVAVGGSWMLPQDAIRAGDFAAVERAVRAAASSTGGAP